MKQAIAAASLARFPLEACGFILATGQMVEATNAAEDPAVHFLVDSDTLLRWWPTGQVIGVWHSHCFDPAIPSDDDEQLAHPELECWIYSVTDEQLGVYRPDDQGKLQLVYLEELTCT